MEQITLQVEGMTCNNCVKAVEESVGNLTGVQSVKVELDTKKVTVQFDANTISLNNIKNEIEEQGYDVA